jgi:hypothetical protein
MLVLLCVGYILITSNNETEKNIMKKEFILTSFTDEHGILGWCIGELDNTFNDLVACSTGQLLAHDILEHNHSSELIGVSNELEALGAVCYIRGSHLRINYDLLSMAYDSQRKPLKAPHNKPLTIHSVFTNFRNDAAKMIGDELGTDTLGSEERKNLSSYLRNAPSYMQNGYEWAEAYYGQFNVSGLFFQIENSFTLPDFEGQQAKISIDFLTCDVSCDYDDPYDYDDE